MSLLGLNQKSTLVALVVTVLAIVVLVKLGLWQIDRGQEKQAIVDQHASAQARGPLSLSQSLIDSATLQTDDQVRVHGRFETGKYFLLDNQIYSGRVGYQVIALLNSPQLTQRLAVNLGWVPLPGGRDTLPEIELPEGSVDIVGRVHYPAERPFLLREQNFSATLPQRIQYLEIGAINQQMNMTLLPFSVLLDESLDFGFSRDWPVVVSEPHRHYAYAVQWFGLAIAALIIFLLASRRTVKREKQTK